MPALKDLDDVRDLDDVHRDIPKDENGDPIYFVLTDGVQTKYERKRDALEAAWRATSDPAFVGEAHTWSRLHRQPSPAWLDEAVWTLVAGRRTKTHAKRAREAHIRFMRYEVVRDAQTDGVRMMKRLAERAAAEKDKELAAEWRKAEQRAANRGWVTWEEAKALAVEILRNSPAASPQPDTMWKDYKRVKADLKKGRNGFYFMPKTPNPWAMRAHYCVGIGQYAISKDPATLQEFSGRSQMRFINLITRRGDFS